MDAQGRGRADEIDPADQWVLNPDTGNYELRLDRSVGQPSASRPRRAPAPPSGRTTSGSGTGETVAHGRTTTTPRRKVPGPRRGDGPPPGGRRSRKRRPEKSRKKKALLITGGAMAFVMVAGSLGLYLYYKHLDSNINTIGVGDAGSGGFKKDQAVNILLVGTDKRTGSGNEGYGDKNSPGHADTTILFHVSKDRTNATAVSIPRDLITDIPDCPTKLEDGTEKIIPGQQGVRFNTSLGQSGRDPGCTMRTVKELTGLTVDNFMMADFNAIKTLTTAVGGVEVCVAKDVNDEDSKLKLTKGTHTIEGEQALAFVRTRHSFGNESDLDRIQTQQQFLSSLIRKMKSEDTLTSPGKLMDLAEAGTKALTVDDSIGGIKELAGLAKELAKVNPQNITFTTLPVIDNPAEKIKATVVVNESKAAPLFAMMRSDTSLTEVKKQEKAAKSKQDALLKGERAEPTDVRVDVYNGGGPAGSAQTTLNWLQNEQDVPKSSNLGNAPAKVSKTTLEYAPNQADQARALADMMGLPASALKPGTTDAAERTPMTLTLGEDFKGAGIPISGPAKAPKDIQQVQADKAVCSK
ncbi:LCP family protein [Streptomyces sp. NPDC051219]|uniref:LCP family protein n=1 Tax=Streptomyces sp. NPDC051219 TaxID=3155283 RepID=UPI00343D2D3F